MIEPDNNRSLEIDNNDWMWIFGEYAQTIPALYDNMIFIYDTLFIHFRKKTSWKERKTNFAIRWHKLRMFIWHFFSFFCFVFVFESINSHFNWIFLQIFYVIAASKLVIHRQMNLFLEQKKKVAQSWCWRINTQLV